MTCRSEACAYKFWFMLSVDEGYYNCTPAARRGERTVSHHVVLERERERLHIRAGLPVAAPQAQAGSGQTGVASCVISPRAGSSSQIIIELMPLRMV